jgi:hypothetical protein
MKKLWIAVLITGAFLSAGATDGAYAVSRIPAELFKGANAVLRLEEIRFEINSTRETVTKNHYVITILNENGDDWAEFHEYYDKHRQIESVEGFLYDAYGKQLKRIKKKDLEDRSGVADISLMDDNRFKRHNFYYKVYPYTIEYFVETVQKTTLFFPSWTPQGSDRISVEKSTMSIVCQPEYKFRYKAFNYDKAPVLTQEKSRNVSTWCVSSLPAIAREAYSPGWHELTTMVIFGPTDFQMDDYKGNMSSWQDFGKFVYSLKAGRDQLPDNVKQAVHAIADRLASPMEKIARLYEYMQKNTRYISIQLGIGGWQPFDAKEVATKGYGDCKALANYMYSLLKEAGINSFYTVIRAGRNATYITDDFPSQQFNHVILCVPLDKKDSVWLECTSQTMQAGYLGDFTANRCALLIDENGGKLVRTPKYGLNENLRKRAVKAKLGPDGTLLVKADTRYVGMQQDDIHAMINQLSKEKVKEYLHEQLDFSTYDINRFDYKELKTALPAIDETLDITVSNYATITGKRLFIVPNVMTRSTRKLSQDSTRKYDIELGFEFKDVDSVEIEIPEGYTTESLPQPVTIKNKFGSYCAAVKFKDNKLYYYRAIEQNSGRFPAGDYGDLVQFYNEVYKSDRGRVVLLRNEEAPKKAF